MSRWTSFFSRLRDAHSCPRLQTKYPFKAFPIRASFYFPPGQAPRLYHSVPRPPPSGRISIGFVIRIPLPSRERELLPASIPPVTLPSSERLTFSEWASILMTLSLRSGPHSSSDSVSHYTLNPLVKLTEFIRRAKKLACVVAQSFQQGQCLRICGQSRTIGC